MRERIGWHGNVVLFILSFVFTELASYIRGREKLVKWTPKYPKETFP